MATTSETRVLYHFPFILQSHSLSLLLTMDLLPLGRICVCIKSNKTERLGENSGQFSSCIILEVYFAHFCPSHTLVNMQIKGTTLFVCVVFTEYLNKKDNEAYLSGPLSLHITEG